jgi:hypothetical protein
MAEVDYSQLSGEDLEEEIRREEEALAGYKQDLQEAQDRRDDLQEATSEERITELAQRTSLRQQRISRYERAIAELESQIRRYTQRLASREAEIHSLQDSISFQESRLARVTGMERYITSQTIERLRRSLAILQGWQTRDTGYLQLVRNTRAEHVRVLAALRSWQTRETSALERVDEMRAELVGELIRISSLKDLIATETARLERKRTIRVRFKLTITVNNIEWGTTTPAPGEYLYVRNTTATVTAKPHETYKLDHWQVDGKKVEPHPGNTISILMDADHTLEAVFAVVLVARLHRVKIRLYNMERSPTPTGMFQGLFDIDALVDTRTGLVIWDWWLTQREINIAKYHFIGYFKGMAKWREPEQVSLAYFDSSAGIPHETDKVKYKYSKNVPQEFIAKAEVLTVGELIVGESSVQPKPNPNPTSENMGVYVERFMIIDADGAIKWDEIREKWVWHPDAETVNRVKEELKI